MDANDEIKFIQETWTKLWQTYMTWFTWHFGIHIVAFGAVFSIPAIQKMIVPVATFAIGFQMLTFAGSAAMISFEERVQIRTRELLEKRSQDTIFGGLLTRYVAVSVLASNVLLFVAWLYLLYARPFS